MRRYIGSSAHSEEAAHAAMDRFNFDSILFPLSFTAWIKGKFGPSVYERATKSGMGILALKAMMHGNWPEDMKESERPWEKAWYEPFDEIDKAALGLRFTLHLPVDALIPPGHWELFEMAGRYWQVIYVPEENPDSVFVITAYELRGNARTAYRRRQRRKPR